MTRALIADTGFSEHMQSESIMFARFFITHLNGCATGGGNGVGCEKNSISYIWM